MPFSLTAMFLMLTCCIPATIAVCEDSYLVVEEGQTAELPAINLRSRQQMYYWCSNKKQRDIAGAYGNRVGNINKPEKYQVSTNSSHIFITILNVSIDDTGLYVVHSWLEDTLEVIRLSVDRSDVVTEVDTVITRRGSTIRFPKRRFCNGLFFRPNDSSISGENFNSKHFTRIRCSDSIIANEETEGCYVMKYIEYFDKVYLYRPYSIYIQRIQLSDIEITVRSDGISCEENPPVSGLPFRLEHQYNGSTIRHVENNGTASLILPLFPFGKNDVYQCISYTDINKSTVSQKKLIKYFDSDCSNIVMNEYTVNCYERFQNPTIYVRLEHLFMDTPIRYTEAHGNDTVQLPLFPRSFHNNGIYKCIFYINKRKSEISETKSLSFSYKGFPVFAKENRNLLQGEFGRNLSIKVLVYSNPIITNIEVIGENRSTDNFIINDICTKPASLNGWNGTTENIPGWEVNIDIMFEIPQNITLWIVVENAIGNNKFRIIANIKNSLILMNEFAVTCNSRGLDPTLYIRLEHSFRSTVIRHAEAQAFEIVQLPLLPIPFHNNGVYKCIFYTDKKKSAISQTKSLLYKHKGLPVFAEGDKYLLQGEYGRNLSVKVLVYSNPNITEIEVIGENRSTDGFIVHDIKTLPASLNGWNGPSVNIPGCEITIDIMFHIQQNVTLYLIVDNILGSNKFKMKVLIEEPTTPDASGHYSIIIVATCILGILLFCIITLTTVNCIIMKRRSSTTVEIERSPYIYDEIGTIDYRVTNVPPPIRDVVVPGITRRMELNRVIQNISQDRISIETEDDQQDDMITNVNAADTTETRPYLSLPCSVRSSDTTNEEEITPTETQNNLYEAVSSNIPPEHLYNQCENSRDTDTQEVPKEYINLKIW